MKSLIRGALSAFPTLLLAVTLNADTLVLRNGRRLQGQLISVRENVVEFDEAQPFGGGRAQRFDRSEVLGIEFDRNDRIPPSYPPATGAAGAQRGRPAGLRERQVFVAANVQWTDTNIDVQPGQDVYFDAGGDVRWRPDRRDGPAGEQNSPTNPNRPIPNRPAGSLIGRVGGNSTDYFFIGTSPGPFRMRSAGRLILGVNDDNLQDNSGAFRVIVYY
jgi:hypothetical protein